MEQNVETDRKQVAARPIKPPRPRKMERDFFEGKGLSPEERRAVGNALRDRVRRENHGEWKKRPDRPDPIDILIDSNKGCIPELVPIRHGRMVTSPFAYLRGAAAGRCGPFHDPGAGARALRRRRNDFRISRQQRRLRRSGGEICGGVRRPDRERSPGTAQGVARRPLGGSHGVAQCGSSVASHWLRNCSARGSMLPRRRL